MAVPLRRHQHYNGRQAHQEFVIFASGSLCSIAHWLCEVDRAIYPAYEIGIKPKSLSALIDELVQVIPIVCIRSALRNNLFCI